MALELVDKTGTVLERVLEREEDAALRAVKAGDADEEQHELYLRTVGDARARELWFLCDCRSNEAGERPVIVPRKGRAGRYFLVNRPNPELPHAGSCVFGPVADEDEERPVSRGRAPRPVHGDRFDPFAPAEKDDDEPTGTAPRRTGTGPSRAPQHTGEAAILRMLMQTARLNRLDTIERMASPGDWLPEIVRAAAQFTVADGIPASEFLFTDPADWTGGEVARRLEGSGPRWPRGDKPFAMLCWPALSLGSHDINPDHRDAGHVAVESGVHSPEIGGGRGDGGGQRREGGGTGIGEPWLVLGTVARSGETGSWACLKARAQPIVAPACPVPVDSGQERRAFAVLRRLVRELERDERLRHALGGPVRVELEKPLTWFVTDRRSCLPDFLVTVAPPGAGSAADRRDGRSMARYVIEVMGLDNPEYEKTKIDTHARMRRIGRLFRMEANQFDSPFNGIERQGERIMRDIANDLIRRWGMAAEA